MEYRWWMGPAMTLVLTCAIGLSILLPKLESAPRPTIQLDFTTAFLAQGGFVLFLVSALYVIAWMLELIKKQDAELSLAIHRWYVRNHPEPAKSDSK